MYSTHWQREVCVCVCARVRVCVRQRISHCMTGQLSCVLLLDWGPAPASLLCLLTVLLTCVCLIFVLLSTSGADTLPLYCTCNTETVALLMCA